MTPTDEQTLELTPLDTAHPEVEISTPEANDAEDTDPPHWVQQSSLTDVLLWRLGIPLDRERLERQQSEKGIDLTPPITTRKVADAIAQVSMQVMRGELDAASAKTSLYALQTLLTALRLQIIEEKKPKDTTKNKTKNRRPRNAKRPSRH